MQRSRLGRRDEVMFFDYRAFNEKLPVTVLAYDKEPLVLQYSPDLTLEVIIHELGGISPLVDSSRVEICVPDYQGRDHLCDDKDCSLNAQDSGTARHRARREHRVPQEGREQGLRLLRSPSTAK